MSLSEKIDEIRQLEKGRWVVILLKNGSNIKGKIHEVNGRIYLQTLSFRRERKDGNGKRKIGVIENISVVEFLDVRQVGVDSEKYKDDYCCFYDLVLSRN